MRIEDTILQNLFNSERYCRTVVPFLKPEYFADSVDRHVVEEFLKFFNQHNHPATSSIISLELRGKKGISDAEIKKADELMTGLPGDVSSHDWAIEKTEDFCQKRSVYNAIVESIGIIDGSDKKHTEDAIPKLLADALAVSFNIQVGHDYIEDAEKRYDFYTQKEDRIPFGIDALDESTGGGMVRKALYCVAAQCVHPDTLVRIRCF